MTWVERLRWACDVAEGMAFIHGRGFAHRDLKSQNVSDATLYTYTYAVHLPPEGLHMPAWSSSMEYMHMLAWSTCTCGCVTAETGHRRCYMTTSQVKPRSGILGWRDRSVLHTRIHIRMAV